MPEGKENIESFVSKILLHFTAPSQYASMLKDVTIKTKGAGSI